MTRLLVIILILLLTDSAFSQEENNKSGWTFGVLPAVSFNTDLGFQFGGLINLYDYGDGSDYPNYNHSLFLEISAYTKGSGTYQLMFDSDHLIPGINLTTDIAYIPDQAYDFYGFNGYVSVYNADWVTDKTRMFYKHKRNLFRFKNDIKGKIYGDNLFWNAGLTLKNFAISSVDVDKLNKGKDPGDLLPDPETEPGVYELYKEWGILDNEEVDGGFITALKAGITFDSRDYKTNAMKGIWFETGIEFSPSFLSEESFAIFYIIHRQYFTIIERDLSFAYRIGYQSAISGEIPYYYQTQIITSLLPGTVSEGLGGAKNLRGIMRNRVIGEGVVYGNAELRWKAWHFNWINNNFYLGVVGFFDLGQVTKLVDFQIPGSGTFPVGEDASNYFNPGSEKMHMSTGAGLRGVMNENFVVAIDLGFALNDQDGTNGLYIGLNYLF
jgi:hypothetical protein